MASGEVPGIELYPDVDNTRQGEEGILNFYKFNKFIYGNIFCSFIFRYFNLI